MNPAVRLAVDIGGTFTDLVLQSGSETTSTKVLTTPDAPADGVLFGVGQVLEQAGVEPDAVSREAACEIALDVARRFVAG